MREDGMLGGERAVMGACLLRSLPRQRSIEISGKKQGEEARGMPSPRRRTGAEEGGGGSGQGRRGSIGIRVHGIRELQLEGR